MRVLVTGGAGYIGTELVYRLASEPSIKDILVYDNLCKGNYNLFTGLRKVPTLSFTWWPGLRGTMPTRMPMTLNRRITGAPQKSFTRQRSCGSVD